MRTFIVFLCALCVLTVPARAGDAELETLSLTKVGGCCGTASIHYVPALTKIINEPIPMESGGMDLRVAELRLSPESTDTLIIQYSEGESGDPQFIIYRVEGRTPRRLGLGIDGLYLEAPGDGYFYVRGHTDSWFDMRRKFTVKAGDLHEVKQPFYYVGLETKTLDQIVIYGNQGCSEMTQWIPKGTPVTVILNDGYSFLLKVDHDVLGWWRPKNMSQQRAEEIEGIYFAGD